RGVLAETLRDLGHAPIEAADGREGLAWLANDAPDAVFLDFQMPGVNGLEFLQRLRARPDSASLPVVMLTAFASSANTIEAMRLGAFEHLAKPIGLRDLESLLERMLPKPLGPTAPHTPPEG